MKRMKRSVVAWIALLTLTAGLLSACGSGPDAVDELLDGIFIPEGAVEAEENTGNVIGSAVEGIDVPEAVLEVAKTWVEDRYIASRQYMPENNYSNWRIEALQYVYTYEEFNGMTLDVYQMNYEFLSDTPEDVMLAGGMYVTVDGWVMPGYPNCTFLIFRDEGESLTLLTSMMENDCVPGDETFTGDLQQWYEKEYGEPPIREFTGNE